MRQVASSRRASAALVVVILWVISMVCEAQPISGAPIVAAESEHEELEVFVDANPNEEYAEQRRLMLDRRWAEEPQVLESNLAWLEGRSIRLGQLASRGQRRSSLEDLTPESFRSMVTEIALRFDLDPRLVASVITVESAWNPRLVGTHRDSGLMQIIPDTAAWIASRLGLKEPDLFDPATNVTMGSWYLHVLIQEYGNWPQALAAYNGGPGMAFRGAEYPYTVKVLSVYNGNE